jgi:hypothetical protein
MGLVFFDAQHIVGASVDDLCGNLCLSAHDVYGDDTTVERQQLQQLRNGGDFVALVIHLYLSQLEMVGCRPPNIVYSKAPPIVAVSAQQFTTSAKKLPAQGCVFCGRWWRSRC